MNCYCSRIFALLVLVGAGSVAEERRTLDSPVKPTAKRLAPPTSASVCLEAAGKGRDFLVNLMDDQLDLLPESTLTTKVKSSARGCSLV